MDDTYRACLCPAKVHEFSWRRSKRIRGSKKVSNSTNINIDGD